jgi:hypothetical protein
MTQAVVSNVYRKPSASARPPAARPRMEWTENAVEYVVTV